MPQTALPHLLIYIIERCILQEGAIICDLVEFSQFLTKEQIILYDFFLKDKLISLRIKQITDTIVNLSSRGALTHDY